MVPTAFPLIPGSVVRCRPVAVLKMTDESGDDAKVLAVPMDSITTRFAGINGPDDMPPELMDRIAHFFEHYKDLDGGKWARVEGWAGAQAARDEIINSIRMFEEAPDPKPHF